MDDCSRRPAHRTLHANRLGLLQLHPLHALAGSFTCSSLGGLCGCCQGFSGWRLPGLGACNSPAAPRLQLPPPTT